MSKIIYNGLRGLGRELRGDAWRDARYVILVDENTFNHCLPRLVAQVEALQEASFIEVPVGEEAKSLEVAAQVWQTLLDDGADRQTVVVNLGGGCVSDLGGYVAATYKRGLRHINVPTTLLAMTDAAIGGKTAINFGGVKNSLGHFHQPALVCLDTSFLATLPADEMLDGTMEMVKTAAVTDPTLYASLLAEDNFQIPISNSQIPIPNSQLIKSVARIKARVVKADPLDRSVRRILNFGHTFGHAIEVHSGLPHGVAVGIGMKAAMYLSIKKTGLAEEVYKEYSAWLRGHMPVPRYTLRDIEAMLPLMHHDKKSREGSLQCVLLQELGAPVIDVAVSDNEVRDTLLKL